MKDELFLKDYTGVVPNSKLPDEIKKEYDKKLRTFLQYYAEFGQGAIQTHERIMFLWLEELLAGGKQ